MNRRCPQCNTILTPNRTVPDIWGCEKCERSWSPMYVQGWWDGVKSVKGLKEEKEEWRDG